MAGAFTCNPFALKTLPTTSASPRRLFPPLSPVLLRKAPPFRPLRLRAAADEDFVGEVLKEGGEALKEGGEVLKEGALAVSVAIDAEEVADLKLKLKNLLYGTDRGLNASSDTRAQVVELITQIEAKNPTPAPTEALPLLNGKWILGYTSFVQLFPLLGSGGLVKVEEISQTIDSEAFTVQNTVQFTGPLATTTVTSNAKFEVRSPKRVQVPNTFEKTLRRFRQVIDTLPSIKQCRSSSCPWLSVNLPSKTNRDAGQVRKRENYFHQDVAEGDEYVPNIKRWIVVYPMKKTVVQGHQ